MSEIKKILRAWVVSSMLAKWVLIGAAVGAGVYVLAGPGIDIQITVNQGVKDGK